MASLKKYTIYLVLFVLAITVFLSIEYTLADTDDYY